MLYDSVVPLLSVIVTTKYGLLWYVSDVTTWVGLGFGLKRCDGCVICVEILFQKGILSFKFFNFFH